MCRDARKGLWPPAGYEDSDPQFYIERGVMEGVAQQWVRDVENFLEQYVPL